MKTLRRFPKKNGQGGWVMVFVAVVMFVAATTAAVALTTSMTSHRDARVNWRSVEAEYRAESGLETAEKALLEALAAWRPAPAEGTVDVDGVEVTYTATPTGFNTVRTAESGLRTIVEAYRLEATAEVGGVQELLSRIVNVEKTPIFQFAVFYENDLEVFPGPDMTLHGRVHTNADLHVGSGATLRLDTNYMTAVGNLYRNRKDDPSASTGQVEVRKWVVDPFDPSEPQEYVPLLSKGDLEPDSESGYDSRFDEGWDEELDGDFSGDDDWLPWVLGAREYWKEPDGYADGRGHTIKSSVHNPSELVAPGVGSLAMFEEYAGGDYEWNEAAGEHVPVAAGSGTHKKGFFHGMAGLCLIAQEDGSWSAADADGHDVTASVSGAVQMGQIYDARQGGYVDVFEVDVAALGASGAFPDNGLVYASSYGMDAGTEVHGVQLVNGAELPGPLSVVTQGAAYVQGDYNTVEKKGASVIADAINLLSNAWDGSKESGSGLPEAADTTFNLAFITGNHETEAGIYNGGFENLPRFHESWSGKDCNILGSFVCLFESAYASGKWQYGGDRYQAPRRNWDYDPDFNDTASLPPYTPMLVTSSDVVTW